MLYCIFFHKIISVTPTLRSLRMIKWKDDEGRVQKYSVILSIRQKWREIGELLDMTPTEIKQISVDHRDNLESCCFDVLTAWLEKGSPHYPLTWGGLLEILEDAELNTAATDLSSALSRLS